MGVWDNEQDDDEYIIILDECTLGQPKFFSESRLKLHGEVWVKSCLDTNFQPIQSIFKIFVKVSGWVGVRVGIDVRVMSVF